IGHEGQPPVESIAPVSTVDKLESLQKAARAVYVDDLVRHYILDLVESTRNQPEIELGASPRATIALFHMAQAWALLHGREYALPDDVKAIAAGVLRHRLVPSAYLNGSGGIDSLIGGLL